LPGANAHICLVRKYDLGWARGSTRRRVSVCGFGGGGSAGCGKGLAGVGAEGLDGDLVACDARRTW
jgi:hypothetical protein